jgi:hypothetical protein
MTYKIAAMASKWVEAPGPRSPERVTSRGRRVPVGRVHALDVDRGVTACGLAAHDLRLFPELDWDAAIYERCPACTRARPPSEGSPLQGAPIFR